MPFFNSSVSELRAACRADSLPQGAGGAAGRAKAGRILPGRAIDTFENVCIIHGVAHPPATAPALIKTVTPLDFPGQGQILLRSAWNNGPGGA